MTKFFRNWPKNVFFAKIWHFLTWKRVQRGQNFFWQNLKSLYSLTLPVPGGRFCPLQSFFPPRVEKLFYRPETWWESKLQWYASFCIKQVWSNQPFSNNSLLFSLFTPTLNNVLFPVVLYCWIIGHISRSEYASGPKFCKNINLWS